MRTTPRDANPVQKHRREVWLKIVVPILLPFLALVAICITLAVAIASNGIESQQLTTLASILATAFIAFPLTILCLIPFALLAVLAHWSGKGYAHIRRPLGAIRNLSDRVAETTHVMAPRLARPTVAINVRLARWEALWHGHRKPVLPVERKAAHE